MAILGLGCLAGAFIAGGLPAALGFALGGAFSALNFWVLHRVVNRIGESGPSASSSHSMAALLGMRYLFFGASSYVILTSFEASIPAALAGVCLAIVAVLFEVIYELIYGT